MTSLVDDVGWPVRSARLLLRPAEAEWMARAVIDSAGAARLEESGVLATDRPPAGRENVKPVIGSDTITQMSSPEPSLDDVLERAAELQRIVPGAVLVGGSAAAYRARHRRSFDHDHVLDDLAGRFDAILENLEALGDWSMVRAQPGKIILGELGGIETGLRQLIRRRALETEQVDVRGKPLTVPTEGETLRIKAWLAVTRNQTRDYLDIAALADHMGIDGAAEVLAGIDEYYADINEREEAVSSQLVRQLADPRPRDVVVTTQLSAYKGLDARWHDWATVCDVLRGLATLVAS